MTSGVAPADAGVCFYFTQGGRGGCMGCRGWPAEGGGTEAGCSLPGIACGGGGTEAGGSLPGMACGGGGTGGGPPPGGRGGGGGRRGRAGGGGGGGGRGGGGGGSPRPPAPGGGGGGGPPPALPPAKARRYDKTLRTVSHAEGDWFWVIWRNPRRGSPAPHSP